MAVRRRLTSFCCAIAIMLILPVIALAQDDLDVKFHKRSAVCPAGRALLQERGDPFRCVLSAHQIAQV